MQSVVFLTLYSRLGAETGPRRNELDLKKLETLIIEERAAAYGHTSVDDAIRDGDADLERLKKAQVSRPMLEAVWEQIQAMFAMSIELMADHIEEERWRTGVEGAILEGRLSALREILDWMGRLLCSGCENEIGEEASFCSHCGAAVSPPTIPRSE